eukprot:TRINITY_DN31417_c0_g1_i5.p1 TRINITY_DN31417_c0_g1~~TRINITY_DN31417_c0_g1_i5.p1  ORF type:complete len:387 (+),score=26.07 TRINITY_DN31417_c0_g1_i5:134-1294(+)
MEHCPIDTEWEGRVPCLYGLISASLCVANMCLRHPEEMAAAGLSLEPFAEGIIGMLWAPQRVLEFFDVSGWPFSVEDVAVVVESIRLQGAAWDSGVEGVAPRPWSVDSVKGQLTLQAVQEALAAVSLWRTGSFVHTLPATRRASDLVTESSQTLTIYSYGTHCSVMAEPISALAHALQGEVTVRSFWRGGKDYCDFHRGHAQGPEADGNSRVGQVTTKYLRQRLEEEHPHQDVLLSPREFARDFKDALLADSAFQQADIAFCSEPAYACKIFHELGKPVLGYFGVHVGFLVDDPEDQRALYEAFRDGISKDRRSTLLTQSPYLSQQIHYHTTLELPAVLPLSLYTLPAAYTGYSFRRKRVSVQCRSQFRKRSITWNVLPLLSRWWL